MPASRTTAALLASLLLAAAPLGAQTLNLPRASQNASVSQTIGTTDLSIRYCRPGVKGRAIWGALVPWDKPWRTGANEITQFTTTDSIQVEGQPLPAGSYGVVTIPGRDRWVVVFSRQKDMWGSTDYDPKQDQLRVNVTPAAAARHEWLQFTFDAPTPQAVELALRWDTLRVAVRIAVDVEAKVLRDARAAIAAAKPDDWHPAYRAGNWAVDNGVTTPEVGEWAARALRTQENFFTLSLNAKLSAKSGRTREAIDRMQKAVALGKTDKDVEPEQLASAQKLLADWGAKP